jgi:hypothetical protein
VLLALLGGEAVLATPTPLSSFFLASQSAANGHFVNADRTMKALHLELASGRARDLVADQCPGGMAEEDTSRLAPRLEARRQIHLPTDGCVVHPSAGNEAPDAGNAGVEGVGNSKAALMRTMP